MNNLPNSTNAPNQPNAPNFINHINVAAESAADKITNAKIEKLRAERDKTAKQLANAEWAIEQDEHKITRLTNSLSQAERKARTRRLIERGAIAESLIPNAAALTNDEFKVALSRLNYSDIVPLSGGEAPQTRAGA